MKRSVLGAIGAAAVLLAGAAQAVGVPGQGTWETTLQGRDLDGNAGNGFEAFYDAALDITWLRNAQVNPAVMLWTTANAWASNLLVGSVGGWRLPTMVDTAASGCDWTYAGGADCGANVQTATSEMAHLFYVTLGNKSWCDPAASTAAVCSGPQAGWGLTNTGGFQNLWNYQYWLGLEYAPDPGFAWRFNNYDGFQAPDPKPLGYFAMAVHPGDVAAVPEPQAALLMLIGLAGLALARRHPATTRNKHAYQANQKARVLIEELRKRGVTINAATGSAALKRR